MTDNEIREKVLESGSFVYTVAEQIVDKVNDVQWALIANYVLSNAAHMRRHADKEVEIGRYVLEILKPICERALEYEIEQYKNKHDITYGAEDE